LVREATRRGVSHLAVTDHDTVAGLEEAIETAAGEGLELIPGIEVSATGDGTSVHVLGLFIKHREPWLVDFFSEAQRRRVDRIHRILQKLAELGVQLEAEEVFAKSSHGSVGRPHVAEVLVERGLVPSYAEAFDRYLGQRAPAYVGYEKITTADAIEIIRRAGGVASLAHPGLMERDTIIPPMVEEGLQAIEVYHSEHAPETAARYRELARAHGLLITGGSDFHAIDGAGKATLGCPELTAEAFEAVRKAARS
jgi:hypothetical protein